MRRIDVKLDDIPQGKPLRVEHEGDGIVVIRNGNALHAYPDRCPHAGWRLSDGTIENGVLECPGHAWEFCIETGLCNTVPDYKLVPVKVKTRGARVRFEWAGEPQAPKRQAKRTPGPRHWSEAFARRVLDVAIALPGLSFCVFAVFALGPWLMLDSRGPIFFRQTRVGRFGRRFTLYKLRTMSTGKSGPGITVDGDQRITRLGRFLRRWKIDELPQFWNVLRGDMTLIGPRPEIESVVTAYTPQQARILEYRPGLASMAQLLFRDEAEMLRLDPDPERAYVEMLVPRKIGADLGYERRRTLGSDLALLMRLGLMVVGVGSRDQASLSDRDPSGDPTSRAGSASIRCRTSP